MAEGAHHDQVVEATAFLQILGEKSPGTQAVGGGDEQRFPKRQAVACLELRCRQDVIEVKAVYRPPTARRGAST